jgi:hypothetical protein
VIKQNTLQATNSAARSACSKRYFQIAACIVNRPAQRQHSQYLDSTALSISFSPLSHVLSEPSAIPDGHGLLCAASEEIIRKNENKECVKPTLSSPTNLFDASVGGTASSFQSVSGMGSPSATDYVVALKLSARSRASISCLYGIASEHATRLTTMEAAALPYRTHSLTGRLRSSA